MGQQKATIHGDKEKSKGQREKRYRRTITKRRVAIPHDIGKSVGPNRGGEGRVRQKLTTKRLGRGAREVIRPALL